MAVVSTSILAIITLTLVNEIKATGSHKDYCNETISCNQSSLLTCQDSLCECILADSMTFSEDKDRCVSLADEACGHMSMDTSEVLLQCVPNGFCNSQGYCQCTTGHFKDHEGHCIGQKDFGEACDSDLECLGNLGLLCVNETCNCNRTVSIDSLKFGDISPDHRCLARAGHPCLNGHCVPNSSCKNNRDGADREEGVQNVKMCMCLPGFEGTARGLCLATFNKTCDTLNHINCKKDLACLNGLCHCKYPRDHFYDKNSETCQALVGGPCHINSESILDSSGLAALEIKCVSNAVCRKVRDSDNEECECDEGFVENKERRCDIGYRQPCSSSWNDQESPICDQLAQLTCRDGRCLCMDESQIFDKYLWKCRGLVGSHCRVNGDDTNKDDCVKYAECRGRRNGRLSQGQCQCKEDFEETEARKCSCPYCNDEDEED